MVSRLSRRFRRYCKFLAHSPFHSRRESDGDGEASGSAAASAVGSSMEQLTGGKRRRSSSIGSAGSRLKMRLRRCTSSPG
ncbi:uncharacterized protein [Drosophila bipectinata]|uniref:uncharacterized protein n=1 Tax=Drosophila bipectinata TaxID=42026 RepID=UPI0038B328E2